MTLFLEDMFSLKDFDEMRQAGFVKVQRHPEFFNELAIANYTQKAQANYHWNDVTEQCRGLIYDPSTYEVIARPFRKFYNSDESNAARIAPSEHVSVYDKIDGSLGIAYARPDGEVAIATRGSFTSDQALWATNWIREHEGRYEMFKRNVLPWRGALTDLFEIVYPENRIVVSYSYSGLVYLNTVDASTGVVGRSAESWNPIFVNHADLAFAGTYEHFLMPQRENAEGYVVVADDGKRMFKLKYEEYVRLHRIVTNLSERAVWEMMGGPYPDKIEDIARQVDEEHAKWVREVAQELFGNYMKLSILVNELYQQTAKMSSRKDKAIFVTTSGYPKAAQSAFFAGLDNKSYVDILWKALRPKGDSDGEETMGS